MKMECRLVCSTYSHVVYVGQNGWMDLCTWYLHLYLHDIMYIAMFRSEDHSELFCFREAPVKQYCIQVTRYIFVQIGIGILAGFQINSTTVLIFFSLRKLQLM